MADVTDRGQLILIMGLVLAVAFVALIPLLNTVIYTENLASRGTDVGGADALEARGVVVDGVAGLLAEENDLSYTDRGQLNENVTDGIDEFGFVLLRSRVEHGVVLEVSDLTIDDGGLVVQTNSTRELTDKDSNPDWMLVDDATESREFVIDITDASALNTTTDPKNEAFNVKVTDGTDVWNLYVYDNSGTRMAVRNGSQTDPTKDVCSPSSTPQINLTNGTVDGQPCEAIEFAKGVSSPYDIEYVYGNRSVGTYNLTANVSSGSVVDSNLQGAASGNSPYWEPVVYAVHVDVLYETYPLAYRTRVRIVPEGVG